MRYCLFGDNWPWCCGFVSKISLFEYESGLTNKLGVKADRLPDQIPNEPVKGINLTIPWELLPYFKEMQDAHWKKQFPPYGDPPANFDWEDGPYRMPKHWDDNYPDPDTLKYLVPDNEKLLPDTKITNQTLVREYLWLVMHHGVDSGVIILYFLRQMEWIFCKHREKEYAPGGKWPSDMEASSREMAWCEEPLETLCQWANNDTLEYYRRSENMTNFTSPEFAEFTTWARGRDEEYKELELKAWDLYARRRGYKHGVMRPIRMNQVTSPDQVWTDHFSDDYDAEKHPEFPWNQPRTKAEIARERDERWYDFSQENQTLELSSQVSL